MNFDKLQPLLNEVGSTQTVVIEETEKIATIDPSMRRLIQQYNLIWR